MYLKNTNYMLNQILKVRFILLIFQNILTIYQLQYDNYLKQGHPFIQLLLQTLNIYQLKKKNLQLLFIHTLFSFLNLNVVKVNVSFRFLFFAKYYVNSFQNH